MSCSPRPNGRGRTPPRRWCAGTSATSWLSKITRSSGCSRCAISCAAGRGARARRRTGPARQLRPDPVLATPAERRPGLQPVGGGHAEQAEAVGQNDPGRVSQPQPRPAEIAGWLAVTGQHAAGVVETVVRAGQVFQVSRDSMLLAQFRRPGHHHRELCETHSHGILPDVVNLSQLYTPYATLSSLTSPPTTYF